MRVYAVGDIHGQTAGLAEALARIAADRRRTGDSGAPVVFLGDLVAKGPDSRGVIETLMEGQARGEPWLVLKGNHDRMFSLFLDDPEARDPGMRSPGRWLDPENGGDAVLTSYGVPEPALRPLAEVHAEALDAVPQAHRVWLAGLLAHWLTPVALFVHAGIRPAVDLQDQDETDLLWIRKPFQQDRRDHGVLVVHGHTPGRQVRHCDNRVNLDTGAAMGGPVSAVRIEAGGVWLLEGESARHLRPGRDGARLAGGNGSGTARC